MSESKHPSLSPVEEERERRRGFPPIVSVTREVDVRAAQHQLGLKKDAAAKDYTERKGGEQHEKQKQQVQSPLLQPMFKTAPTPFSSELRALTEPQHQQQQSPRSAAQNANSRIQKRLQKTASLGAAASPLRLPGRTITGLLTPEARAEEERIAAASSKLKNTESIITIVENEQKMIQRCYDAYTNSRDVHGQSKKLSRFISQLSQYLDKTRVLVYSHLLTITRPKLRAPHESPPTKLNKLFKQEPQALVRHLNKKLLEINNKLYDLSRMTMHAPKYEDTLQEILKLLDEHAALQREYLYPLLRSLYPTESSLVAYGSAWSEYLLRAKTTPQPPAISEDIARMAIQAGLSPMTLAKKFEQQEHI